MNARKAAPVIAIASLVVLMSGCAGAAAQGGQVPEDLSPAANAAAAIGLARGHVIVNDSLSPTRVEDRLTAESVAQAVKADAQRAWSADARREFHTAAPEQALGTTMWSADARREFHAQKPDAVTSRTLSPEAIRELKAGRPGHVSAADMQGTRLSEYAEAHAAADVSAAEVQGQRLSAYGQARSDAAIRELKGSAPVDVKDDLSPIQGWTPPSEPPADTVDDDLSPIRGWTPPSDTVDDDLSPLGGPR